MMFDDPKVREADRTVDKMIERLLPGKTLDGVTMGELAEALENATPEELEALSILAVATAMDEQGES